jgi:NTP pyrophosphatase (non-canonical NTP hydrolase)
MTFDEYQEEAYSLAGTNDPRMFALGLAGESGEAVELVKKAFYHGVPYDNAKLVKELGDVMWYVAGLAATYELSLEDIARANLEKLRERYPDGFVLGGGIRDYAERGGDA